MPRRQAPRMSDPKIWTELVSYGIGVALSPIPMMASGGARPLEWLATLRTFGSLPIGVEYDLIACLVHAPRCPNGTQAFWIEVLCSRYE